MLANPQTFRPGAALASAGITRAGAGSHTMEKITQTQWRSSHGTTLLVRNDSTGDYSLANWASVTVDDLRDLRDVLDSILGPQPKKPEVF
jgi:hypothetical protein